MTSKGICMLAGLALALGSAGALGWRLLHSPPLQTAPPVAGRVPAAARPLSASARSPVLAPAVPPDVLASLQSSTDSAQRRQALLTAMRAWGERDVVAAIVWALEQDESWSALALEAALGGAAATRPDFAAEIGRQLLAADPEIGGRQASALIGRLAAAGRIELAIQLAAAAPASIAPDLMSDAFLAWARQSPEAALAALEQFQDARLRHAALLGVIEGWAGTDPAALAQRAWATFIGEDRRFALRQAIDVWAGRDLGGLTQWLDTIPAGPVRDDGAAVAAAALIKLDPRGAFEWTAKISDPEGRFRTLQRVATETDRAIARTFVAEIAALTPAERSALLRQLECSP